MLTIEEKNALIEEIGILAAKYFEENIAEPSEKVIKRGGRGQRYDN